MEKFYIASLNFADYIGYGRIKKLLNFFGNAQNAWQAKIDELRQVGLPDFALNSFQFFRLKHPDYPDELAQYCHKKNINLCTVFDEFYPANLKQIPSPPAVLYYFGNLSPNALRIAVIGSRNNTEYGAAIATEISSRLADYGATIISGAARGIDTFAHTSALKNKTVAVLGYGIDFAFTASNFNLLKEIALKGAVISAFNPFQAPSKSTFPQRNRFIAGLSQAVIAVEAGLKSGTLIACKYAVDYGRKLFAVPGNIDSPQSAGCNQLIREGAILIRNADDVLFHLENSYKDC